jgi:hypothetical protein
MKMLWICCFGGLLLINGYLALKISCLEVDVRYLEKVSELTLNQINGDCTENDKEIAELLRTYYNKHLK